MLKTLAYQAIFVFIATLTFSVGPAYADDTASKEAKTHKTESKTNGSSQPTVTLGPPVPKDLEKKVKNFSSSSAFIDSQKKKSKELSSPTPIPTFAVQKVAGVKCEYIDTDRVAKKDDGTCYTKMREEPDVKSERSMVLENGDKVQILTVEKNDTEEAEKWLYAEIISSKDKDRIGKKGYIENWIVADKDVPLEEPAPQKEEKEERIAKPKPTDDKREVATAEAKTSEEAETKKVEKKKPSDKAEVMAVLGVKSEYMYTFRVDEDATGAYTKMREKPNVSSERIGVLRNSDKFQVQKEEDGWFYGEIISSQDKKQVGTKGYIEQWLLTGQGVPPKPTATPTPDPATIEETESAPPVDAQIMTGDARTIFDRVNAHRQSIGLPPLNEDPELCGYAAERAPEINNEIFGDSYVHAGYRARGLGSLGIIENQVGMGSVDANFNWWMNSGLHRGSIEGNFGGTCVTCVGPSCIQLFR